MGRKKYSMFLNTHLFFIVTSVLLLTSCQRQAYFYSVMSNHSRFPSTFERYQHPIEVALVLGGGGARGMAHVGVLEVLQKEGIPIDLIVGCSAGSLVGALYANCKDAEQVKSLLIRKKRKDFVSANLLNFKFGLFHRKPFICLMNNCLGDKKFEDLEIPLVVVATDLCGGKLVSFNKGPIVPTVHASCAVPFYFSPIKYDNRTLVDGGVADPIPVQVARDLGAKIVIAVNIEASLEGNYSFNLIDVAVRSAEIKHMQHGRLCMEDADVIIRPDVGHVGIFEEKNIELYEAGKQAAEKALPLIKRALDSLETMNQDLFH